MASKLECIICSESFKNPRILPCGHSFCLECLEGWLKSSTTRQLYATEDQKDVHKDIIPAPNKLSCPECREEHIVPGRGVAGFQKNFALARESDIKPEVPICSNCTLNIQATVRCLDCECWLCEKCLLQHNQMKILRNHKTLSLDEAIIADMEKKSFTIPQYQPCSKHKNKPIEYYCIKCKVVCCQSGSFTDHELHECVTLDERAEDIRTEIQGIVNGFMDCKLQADIVDNSWDKIKIEKQQNVTEINDLLMKTKNSIHQAVETCIQKIQDEVNQDLSRSKELHQAAKGSIAARKKHQEEVLKQLETGTSYEICCKEEELRRKLQQIEAAQVLPRPLSEKFTLDLPRINIQTEINKLFGKVTRKACPAKPTLWRTINGRDENDIKQCRPTDVEILNNGYIAVTDTDVPNMNYGNDKVKVFNPDAELIYQSKPGLFKCPWYISTLPGDTEHLLITDAGRNEVLKWNMRKDEANKFIISGGEALTSPKGISTTRSNDQDIVLIGNSKPPAVFHVDVKGQVLQIDPVEASKDVRRIAGHANSQHVIFTDNNLVTVINNGKVLWRDDKNTISHPRGVVLTRAGEVLVVDHTSSKVLLLSNEGDLLEILLSAEDSLLRPFGLTYNEKLGILAITEINREQIKLYLF